MLELIDVNKCCNRQPYMVYQRVTIAGPKAYFMFPLDYGFWFFVRRFLVRWPEIDAAGAAFAPELRIEIMERAANHNQQQDAIPLRLFTTPASNGIQVNAGGLLTSAGPKFSKLINHVLPSRDNIEIVITGQNGTPFPALVDIAIVGYLVPDSKLA